MHKCFVCSQECDCDMKDHDSEQPPDCLHYTDPMWCVENEDDDFD